MIYALALIGATTVTVLAVRETAGINGEIAIRSRRVGFVSRGEHHLRKTHVFPGIYSDGLSNEGWSLQGRFLSWLGMWWKAHPDDKGDIGVFEIYPYHRNLRLPKEFLQPSRRDSMGALELREGLRSGWVVRPVSFEHLGEPHIHCPLCTSLP